MEAVVLHCLPPLIFNRGGPAAEQRVVALAEIMEVGRLCARLHSKNGHATQNQSVVSSVQILIIKLIIEVMIICEMNVLSLINLSLTYLL